jgi:SAM-dependent methyltransferase
MLSYLSQPLKCIPFRDKTIKSFITGDDINVDAKTVNSFSEEWKSFHEFDTDELKRIGDEYFNIINERHLNKDSLVLDVGCGSGRWSKYIAEKVRFVEAIDPSEAVLSAVELTDQINNIRVTQAGVDYIPFADNSFDFVFSLGVLHHIPDTLAAMKSCVAKLKPGGYFLVYLYYNLDNRGLFYRVLFKFVNILRRIISKMQGNLKRIVCNLIAFFIYLPFAKISLSIKKVFKNSWYKRIPLSYYHDKSFYIMRNDALDRFGTPLEQRFSRDQIKEMMMRSGLKEIVFSNSAPYWHAVGQKKK